MIITQMKIVNFGPFREEALIKFEKGGHGVHIIRGNTGQGKTSIFRAINWALYGEVRDRKNVAIPPSSLMNISLARRDIHQFFVHVLFTHEGHEWSIRRKMEAKKNSDKEYINGMRVDVIRDGQPLSNGQQEINRILPPDVSRFFFFDGEMLGEYEELLSNESSAMKKIRNSIEQILGIPIIKTAKEDVLEVKKKYEQERSRLLRKYGDLSYEKLAEDLKKANDDIEITEESIKKLGVQLDTVNEEIRRIKRRLGEIDGVRKLIDEKSTLEREISSLESNIEKEQENMKTLTSELYRSVLCDLALDVVSSLKHKHEIIMGRYDKKKGFEHDLKKLEKSIKNNICPTCNRVFEAGLEDQLKLDIESLKQQIDELTEIPEPDLSYTVGANKLEKMTQDLVEAEDFRTIETAIYNFETEISTKRSRIFQIKDELGESSEEEIKSLTIELASNGKEQGRLEQIILIKKARLSGYKEGKMKIEQEMRRIPMHEIVEINGFIDVLEQLSSIFEASIDTYREMKRKEVQEVATRIFKKIAEKESFVRLEINENFGLSIVTDTGIKLNKGEWRSAGEEQIVALSLIGALNKCSNVSAPVFMDTPFGRLDPNHGRNILSYLPEMSEQIVLLVTDREFRKEDERVLAGQIVTDYRVKHLSSDEGSIIRYETNEVVN